MIHLDTIHECAQAPGGGVVEGFNRHLLPHLRNGSWPRQNPPGDLARARTACCEDCGRRIIGTVNGTGYCALGCAWGGTL